MVLAAQCHYGVANEDDQGKAYCRCQSGWTGELCERPLRPRSCFRGTYVPEHDFCRCDPLWAGEVSPAFVSRPGCPREGHIVGVGVPAAPPAAA